MAGIFLAIGFIAFIRHKPEFLLLWLTGVLFLVTGMIRPAWLRFIYAAWMKLGWVLAWINTRIVLCVLFYGIMTPIGLAMRLFGVDPLHRSWSKKSASYWLSARKKTYDKSDFERLY
jgi:hypothetical protein